MAKRKLRRRRARPTVAPKRRAKSRSGKRPTVKAKRTHRAPRRPARARSAGAEPKRTTKTRRKAAARTPRQTIAKQPRLERARRTLDETLLTPPSSLNMDRRGSAVRTGRAELRESLKEHTGMTPAITGGDVDANWENAYFSGDEAPGGDNPTPDQDVVDDIGKALGVEYQDAEELKSGDKLADRDKHRWELDPASSEDYKDRD